MRAFQPDAFQESGFQYEVDAAIAQTLPSLTQTEAGTLTEEEQDLNDVLGRAFLFRPKSLEPMRVARIRQTLPSLTQSITAEVNDDELVLLLV